MSSTEMMTSGMLKCTVPPGVGANLTVAVMVGNQTTTMMGNYERITRLNEESSLDKIEEHVQFTYDKPVVESYYPKFGPTTGGNTITIKGFNLDLTKSRGTKLDNHCYYRRSSMYTYIVDF